MQAADNDGMKFAKAVQVIHPCLPFGSTILWSAMWRTIAMWRNIVKFNMQNINNKCQIDTDLFQISVKIHCVWSRFWHTSPIQRFICRWFVGVGLHGYRLWLGLVGLNGLVGWFTYMNKSNDYKKICRTKLQFYTTLYGLHSSPYNNSWHYFDSLTGTWFQQAELREQACFPLALQFIMVGQQKSSINIRVLSIFFSMDEH